MSQAGTKTSCQRAGLGPTWWESSVTKPAKGSTFCTARACSDCQPWFGGMVALRCLSRQAVRTLSPSQPSCQAGELRVSARRPDAVKWTNVGACRDQPGRPRHQPRQRSGRRSHPGLRSPPRPDRGLNPPGIPGVPFSATRTVHPPSVDNRCGKRGRDELEIARKKGNSLSPTALAGGGLPRSL